MLAEVSRPITSPSKKIVNVSIPELQALLDICPDAVILVDTRENRVLLANTRTTELTAYTRVELNGLDLAVLIPTIINEIPWKEISSGQHRDLPLIRHSGMKTDVQVTPTFLDSQKRLAVISLVPVLAREQHQAEQQRFQQRWQALQSLVESSHQPDIHLALKQVLQAGSSLTGASILALYQFDADAPTLRRTYGLEPVERLPECISIHDFSILHTPYTWMSGKRTACDLHRVTRANGFTYTSSVPVGDPPAIIGLIVCAGDTSPAPAEILPALGIVAQKNKIDYRATDDCKKFTWAGSSATKTTEYQQCTSRCCPRWYYHNFPGI